MHKHWSICKWNHPYELESHGNAYYGKLKSRAPRLLGSKDIYCTVMSINSSTKWCHSISCNIFVLQTQINPSVSIIWSTRQYKAQAKFYELKTWIDWSLLNRNNSLNFTAMKFCNVIWHTFSNLYNGKMFKLLYSKPSWDGNIQLVVSLLATSLALRHWCRIQAQVHSI